MVGRLSQCRFLPAEGPRADSGPVAAAATPSDHHRAFHPGAARMKRFCGTPAERHDAKWTPEPNCGCWLWLGATNGNGYGTFKWSASESRLAHRASWEIHRGPVPDGRHVLHRCDVRACVNPAHLFLGTNDDNVADRVAKGRNAPAAGEMNGRAKLTAEDVRMIRASGESVTALARKFGVAIPTVSQARSGRNWRTLAA